MVAAFIWWYVALVQQNELLTATKIETLTAKGQIDQQHIANIEDFATRKTKQYIGAIPDWINCYYLSIPVQSTYVFPNHVKF